MSHREPEAQARPPTPSSGCLPRVSAHGLPGTVTPPSTASSVRSCGHFSVSVSTSDGMFTAASLWGRQGLGGGRGGQLCVLAPGRGFFFLLMVILEWLPCAESFVSTVYIILATQFIPILK